MRTNAQINSYMAAQVTHPMFFLKFLCVPGGHIFLWFLLASSSRFHIILSLTPVSILSFLLCIHSNMELWSFPWFLQKISQKNVFQCSWLYRKFDETKAVYIVIAQNFEFWSLLYLKVCWPLQPCITWTKHPLLLCKINSLCLNNPKLSSEFPRRRKCTSKHLLQVVPIPFPFQSLQGEVRSVEKFDSTLKNYSCPKQHTLTHASEWHAPHTHTPQKVGISIVSLGFKKNSPWMH